MTERKESDEEALRLFRSNAPSAEPHEILHYLYLPDPLAARRVAEELERRGFAVEDRLGADELNWLVLARRIAIPDQALLAADRELMEALADDFDGEYDGWEATTAGTGSVH